MTSKCFVDILNTKKVDPSSDGSFHNTFTPPKKRNLQVN